MTFDQFSILCEEIYALKKISVKAIRKLKNIRERILTSEEDWFIEVSRLSSGQSFGEKALIEDAPRAATIVAIQECFFAVIGRDDYKKCLQRIDQRSYNKKIEFIKQIPFL